MQCFSMLKTPQRPSWHGCCLSRDCLPQSRIISMLTDTGRYYPVSKCGQNLSQQNWHWQLVKNILLKQCFPICGPRTVRSGLQILLPITTNILLSKQSSWTTREDGKQSVCCFNWHFQYLKKQDSPHRFSERVKNGPTTIVYPALKCWLQIVHSPSFLVVHDVDSSCTSSWSTNFILIFMCKEGGLQLQFFY